MRTIWRFGGIAVSALLLSSVPAMAQTNHEISVLLDDATASEDDLLAAAAVTLLDEAPQSIRKLAAGILGEVQVMLNQRLSGDLLTLDDGTQAAAIDGDQITVHKKKKACKEPPCGGGGDTNPAGAAHLVRFVPYSANGASPSASAPS